MIKSPLPMCDENLVGGEEIEQVAQEIIDNTKELKSLEIFLRQPGADDIHVVNKTEKAENIDEFLKYITFRDNEPERSCYSIEYQNIKFILNQATPVDEGTGAISYLLMSSDKNNRIGMVIVVDPSNAIFIATCELDELRNLNYNLYKALYP